MNEVFKDILGYEGLYQISNLGTVKSVGRYGNNQYSEYWMDERILKHSIVGTRNSGYCAVNLRKDGKSKQKYVHRLVAIAFVDNYRLSAKYVNHTDGDSKNNRFDNLEWCTHSENIQHAYDNGLIKKSCGSNVSNSKLKESDIPIIRNMLTDKIPILKIAKQFNVSRNVIYQIKDGRTWKHI